jgi:hypothetical protein
MSALFLMAGLNALNFGMGFEGWDVSGVKKSADQDAASKYCETYEHLVKDNDLTADKIYNADETGIFLGCLPTSILAGEGGTLAKYE